MIILGMMYIGYMEDDIFLAVLFLPYFLYYGI